MKTEKIAVEEGVVCESCHGPGKGYKSKKIMSDREKSIEGGMIYPATKSCVLCHNDQSPTWNPEKYTTKDGKKVGFDAEQAAQEVLALPIYPELTREQIGRIVEEVARSLAG